MAIHQLRGTLGRIEGTAEHFPNRIKEEKKNIGLGSLTVKKIHANMEI